MTRAVIGGVLVLAAAAIAVIAVRYARAERELTALRVQVAQLEQDRVELERSKERLADEIVVSREMLREQTLSSSRRSIDEFLALFPARFPSGDWRPAESLFEDCWFLSADGLRLHGWYLRRPNPAVVVLHLHGNAGNLSYRAPVAEKLSTDLNASVLLFDYRGYGRSEGTPTIEGLLQDARAARQELAQREGVAESEIVLLGESLGGAIAADLAARDGARALVLENTFASLRDVANAHYPPAVVSMLVADRLNSAERIRNFHGPIFQVHGDADTIVPLGSARKLHAAANEPKTLLVLPGHNHNDPLPERYYAALRQFVAGLPAPR